VDDLAFVLGEVFGVANHTVVKTGANGQQHITVLHRVVGFERAMHAQHAQETAIGRRESTQTHQGVGDWNIEHVHQGAQFATGFAHQHTTTGVDVGALGGHQQLQGLADLATMAFAHGVVRAHLDRFGVARINGLVERHILRNVHHHRAGAAAAGNVEGLFHDLGDILDVFDQEVVLHDRTRDAHRIALLEGIQANGRRRNLSADDHHRDAVHVGGGNAGHGIGQAWTGSDQGHPHFTRGTGKTVRSMHRRLLVAHQNVLNGVLLVKSVVNVENGTTRVTPDVFDVFSLQRFDQNFRATQLLSARGGGCRFGFVHVHIQPL
jgi:hypothetical protein